MSYEETKDPTQSESENSGEYTTASTTAAKILKILEEGDELCKIKKYKDAAEKYQEAVNMGSITAAIKLADMIDANKGNIRMSYPDKYNLEYALELYKKAWLPFAGKSSIRYISDTKLRDKLDHYARMGISTDTDTVHSGGYKKRKSNRKHPCKHPSKRPRTRKHKWSLKYKRSIDCKHPKGFSQRQHCKYGRKNMKKLTHKK